MIDQSYEVFFSQMMEPIFKPKSEVPPLFAEPPANQEINVERKKETGFIVLQFLK